MSDLNPYAPPGSAAGVAPAGPFRRMEPAPSVDEAMARLRAFLAEPANVAEDARVRGPRVGVATWVLLAAGLALGIAATVVGIGARGDAVTAAVVFAVVAGVLGLIGLAALAVDLMVVRRDVPHTADAALRAYYAALTRGRTGYALTCLGPAARDQVVAAPALEPVVTRPGEFSLRTAADLKAYAASFARTGADQFRVLKVKRTSLRQTSPDVAQVDVEIDAQSYPRWIAWVALPAFIVIRFVGIILYLALYMALRKRRRVQFSKWMIRGQDGAWYLVDGNALE